MGIGTGVLVAKLVKSNKNVSTYRKALTIAINAATSNALAISDGAFTEIAVEVPATWTGADIGFDVSVDGQTWIALRTSTGARLKITGVKTSAAGVYLPGSASAVLGSWKYMRLHSLDTSDETDKVQAAARSMAVLFL